MVYRVSTTFRPMMDLIPSLLLPPLPPSWRVLFVMPQPAITWRSVALREPHPGVAALLLDRLEVAGHG